MARYPKTMYVDVDATADWGVVACPNPGDHASAEPVNVGEYKFVREVRLNPTTLVEPVQRTKRLAKSRRK